MTVSKIPDLKVFYYITKAIPNEDIIPDASAESFSIGLVSETGATFHGCCHVDYGTPRHPRTQRGYSVWIDSDKPTISKELAQWLKTEHTSSGRHIQMLSWGITCSWMLIGDLIGMNKKEDTFNGCYMFSSYIRPTPIDIATLFLMTAEDISISRETLCGVLPPEMSQCSYALVGAYINMTCFNKLSANLQPAKIELTGELIDELFRSDSHPMVDLIEKWDLGYCLGQAVNNIYNISRSKGELREAYINNALWYLAHARSNEYTKKSFERDTSFHKHLSPSDFFAHYGTGNANIDNAMLDIEVARQYPAVFNELIDGAIKYIQNELKETTEES